MKTIHWVLIFVAVGIVGFAVYYFGFHKKKTVSAPVPQPKPAASQSTGQQLLGFAENAGKKALTDFAQNLFS